jgi:hypothetical protein
MTFRRMILSMVMGLAVVSLLTPCQPMPKESVATPHPLYQIIPRHRSQIACHDVGRWALWVLFGNDDDGVFGERASFRPELDASLTKALLWMLRNPLHNFCFYVIGSADCVNSAWKLLEITPEGTKTLDYQAEADTVFAGKRSSLLLALHGGKPFVSCCVAWSSTHQSKFYLGWRCRGNFGLKCNL